MNMYRDISKFVVLGCITSVIGWFFIGWREYSP